MSSTGRPIDSAYSQLSLSPVNVRDFQNIISVVGLTEGTLRRIGPAGATLARAEGLEAHARAIESRLPVTDPS